MLHGERYEDYKYVTEMRESNRYNAEFVVQGAGLPNAYRDS
jgi:hypothetical protein